VEQPHIGHQADRPNAPGGGVSARAVLFALALIIAIAYCAFYVEIAWRRVYEFGSGVPAMAPVVALFLLTALAGFLRRRGLSRRELLAIYCIVLVSAPLVSHGVLFWMIPKTIAYYYQARVNTAWEAAFLPHIPTWFAPSTPPAVDGFFEGRSTVPWSEWQAPLGAWLSFMLALFGCTFCLVAVLQRQWITHERLSFPMAQIPLEMVRSDRHRAGRASAHLPLVTVFWIGVAISFLVNFMSTLSSKVPSIPAVPLGPTPIVQWQKVGPLAGLGEIDLVFWPWMIAVAYLIPKELSFSAWFFWLVRLALTVTAIAAGAEPQRPEEWYSTSFPAPYAQGGGAALALGIWVLWIARQHLLRAARIALGFGARQADAAEPLSYRVALIGFVLTFTWMVCFFLFAGCRLWFGLVLVSLIVGYYLLWARLRAETGLGFLPFPQEIQDAIVVPFGASIFRPRELVALISTRWAFFPGFGESFEVVTGNALEGFKVADAAQLNARRLAYATVGGFVIALLFGSYLVLTRTYQYGYFNLGVGAAYSWTSWQTRNDGNRIFEYLTNPGRSDYDGLAAMAAGAAFAVFLGVMRLRFWWWPFHPVGYIAANCWGMHWNYLPFFLGWALKTLVIRYGGLRLYRATVPLAIGLIVGDLLNSGTWALVALLTRGRV